MEYNITVQIAGEDVLAGRLFQNVRRGTESTSFSYADSYLVHPKAFSLAPDMPLGAGSFHSVGLEQLRAFGDCMPDRWGRNLMLRAEKNRADKARETPRTLFEADMLAKVNDETRQGAIRVWDKNGAALSAASQDAPREIELPHLLDEADLAATDMHADIRDLLAAGSSLGGARPKASMKDEHGNLHIAKFPKSDETTTNDVCAWEYVALQLMDKCGISTPAARLLRIRERPVLIVQRFDRNGAERIPYISGLSAVQGEDGEKYSYLDLVEFLEESGANPERDIRELWARALFSCALGNCDNHLRNYGFLHAASGWQLSPAFDVNPTQGNHEKYLSTGLDYNEHEVDPAIALRLCDYYRLRAEEARTIAEKMARVLGDWERAARRSNISEASVENMRSCFETGINRLRQAAKPTRGR